MQKTANCVPDGNFFEAQARSKAEPSLRLLLKKNRKKAASYLVARSYYATDRQLVQPQFCDCYNRKNQAGRYQKILDRKIEDRKKDALQIFLSSIFLIVNCLLAGVCESSHGRPNVKNN